VTGIESAHPRGLATLFFTEMWERFSYYGMRGILILYMVDAERGMALSDRTAGAIYGLYTALVYLMALPGGWIADRLIGYRRAVFAGGVIIACGHFCLAVPVTEMFFTGLTLIILGTGLLKPNVSAMVGDLYPEGGVRRDSGFSIYYMGINLGAFFGPLVCGFLGENINWHWGFAAAGVGMIFGLIQYQWGRRHLVNAGELRPELRAHDQQRHALRSLLMGMGFTIVVAVSLSILVRTNAIAIDLERAAHSMGFIIGGFAVVYFIILLLFGGLSGAEKKRVLVIFLLFLGAALFWSGFEQGGSSLTLFADRLTDRVIAGWEMPASWLAAVNPLFIILLAPVFGMIWVSLGSRSPSIPAKFGLGLVLLGIGFAVMAWGSIYASETTQVGLGWLISTYFLHTLGELCLSPVGLSSVTKLSPPKLTGQMMGIWFMGAALGNLMAGILGGRFESLPLPGLFGSIAATAAGAGLIFLVLSRPIDRMGGGIR
jgi:POT family proton-dependent oligopeptide transporter